MYKYLTLSFTSAERRPDPQCDVTDVVPRRVSPHGQRNPGAQRQVPSGHLAGRAESRGSRHEDALRHFHSHIRCVTFTLMSGASLSLSYQVRHIHTHIMCVTFTLKYTCSITIIRNDLPTRTVFKCVTFTFGSLDLDCLLPLCYQGRRVASGVSVNSSSLSC